MKFDETEIEGLAISKSNGFRTKRPNRRPKKTWGHGDPKKIIKGWKDTLRKKREAKQQIFSRKLAVPEAPQLPSFLSQMLTVRPEARRIMSAAQYAALKNQSSK